MRGCNFEISPTLFSRENVGCLSGEAYGRIRLIESSFLLAFFSSIHAGSFFCLLYTFF